MARGVWRGRDFRGGFSWGAGGGRLWGVAGGGEGEDERFAGDAFEVGLDGPGEAVRDRASEGEGFDLEVEAAVALLVGPVGVEAVEEAVVAGGRDLVDARAAGDAVAVSGVEGGEGDVDGGVEDDGDDVVLAGAEAEEGVGGRVPDDGRGDDLRGEVVRVGVEVLEEVLEVGGGAVRDKGGGAPVVEEGVWSGGGGDFFNEELAGAEVREAGGVGGEDEEGGGGLVLLGEAGLDGMGVGVEGGDGGRG